MLSIHVRAAGNILKLGSALPMENQTPELVALFIYRYDRVGVPLEIDISYYDMPAHIDNDPTLRDKFRDAVNAARWEYDRTYGQADRITLV